MNFAENNFKYSNQIRQKKRKKENKPKAKESKHWSNYKCARSCAEVYCILCESTSTNCKFVEPLLYI